MLDHAAGIALIYIHLSFSKFCAIPLKFVIQLKINSFICFEDWKKNTTENFRFAKGGQKYELDGSEKSDGEPTMWRNQL